MHLVALAGLTVVAVYVSYLVVRPFLPAVAWAVALAIMAHPVADRIGRRVPNRTWAAAITTLLLLVGIIGPVAFVAVSLGREAAQAEGTVREMTKGGWHELLARVPGYGPQLAEQARQVDWEGQARLVLARLTGDVAGYAAGAGWAAIQFLVMAFILFYCLRDRDPLLSLLRAGLPVSRAEADDLFTRAADAVNATVYATVMTGLLQGVTGGILFWLLGVSAPILWGTVMVVLAVLPVLGAFLVWVPVAVGLALGDRFGAAAIIVGWGLLMAGPVCNWVYAWLVGGKMRMHEVPALVGFVGGLAAFGLSGMVLGPVALVLTAGLIRMWRERADPPPAVAGPATSSA
jgi:predicted PurR-regulated permease PerM